MHPPMTPRNVLLASLLALLVATPATAQADPSITLSADEADGTVSVDDPWQTQVTVENTAQGTGTPLDPEQTIVFSTQDVPAGWTVSVSPTSVDLAPGESASVTVTVAVSPGSDVEAAAIIIQGYAQGAFPGPLGSDAQSTATLNVERVDSATRTALEVLGPFVWVILAGLLLAGATVAWLAYERTRVPLVIQSDDGPASILAGSRIVLPFLLINRGDEPEHVVLGVSDPPEGWAAFLPVPDLSLGPGDSARLQLTVIAPGDPGKDSPVSLTVTASGGSNPARPAEAVFTVQAGDGKDGG